MTRDEIKAKVYQRIDEVAAPIQPEVIHYPIESILDEAAEQTLRLVPLRAIDTLVDFSDSTITDNGDGSGSVELPEGFIRLAAFRMKSWKSDTPIVVDCFHPIYQLQQSKYTRGSAHRPVVVLGENKLTYFSVEQGTEHVISKARALCNIRADEDFPGALIDILCWIAASKALIIMREESEAAQAYQQAELLISKI